MSSQQAAFEQATALHRANNFPAAEALYRSVLGAEPKHPGANHQLGVLLRQAGRLADSLSYLEAAAQSMPALTPHWLAYIDALIAAHDPDRARHALRDARRQGCAGSAIDSLAKKLQSLGPTHAPSPFAARPDPRSAHQQMVSLFSQGRFADLERHARNHLQHAPDDGFVWKVLGVACKHLGRNDDALNAIRQAAKFAPEDFEAHYNLGNACFEAGKAEEAASSFTKAIELNPSHPESLNNLGQTLANLGRNDEAMQWFERALHLNPGLAVAHNNLGNIFKSRKQYAEAERHYRQALDLAPSSGEAFSNLASALYEQNRFVEAEECTRRSLQLAPDYYAAHLNMGNIQQCQGKIGEAIDSYRTAIACAPNLHGSYAAYLFTINYDPDRSAEEIFEAYREFDSKFCLPLRCAWRPHLNPPLSNRRLKIGYVSPDFRRHVVAHFLEPVLAHHDKTRFELFAYAELGREDEVTARLRGYVDHWIPTIGVSDEALADRIRVDGIDILVDLAGHTGLNRLLVFARKPAPVAVSWLGYGYTTGVSAIDYLLADGEMCPPGCEHLFSESPWRLQTPALAYRAPADTGEVSSLPSLSTGIITFGTLTRGVRINHRIVRAWSEILRRVENSRLLVDSVHFKEQAAQNALAERFAAHGIARERLEIGYHSPPWDVLRATDITLDCFPHNSGTTLFESLYMGVPFITLAGRPSVGRLGSSILHGLGHPEWIAHSEQEYIQKALTLASNLPRLAALRAKLRGEMEKSSLMDEPGFTLKIEAACQEMFKRWQETQHE